MEKLKLPKVRQGLAIAVYILPALLIMGIFVLIPIIESVRMSFYYIDSLYAPWEFEGFKNYIRIFEQKEFVKAFLRTLMFGGVNLVITLGFGMVLAFFVAKHRFLNFFRYVFYLPSVVSAITMGILWSLILSGTESGILNAFLMKCFGMKEPYMWLYSEYTPLVVMAIGLVGAGGGMSLILFTSAINNVPKDIVEAARIDGASGFKIAMKIEIPLIWPILSSFIMLSIIGSLKSFEFIYALTQGGPLPERSTETLGILLYRSTNGSFGYGYNSASGVVMSLIVIAFTILYMVLSRYSKDDNDEIKEKTGV